MKPSIIYLAILFSFFSFCNPANSQMQVGEDIDGEAAGDESGFSVSISADGLRVAIGGHLNSGTDVFAGQVRVYEWTNGNWTQIGGDIDGESALDRSGESVAISADGKRVAIGAIGNNNANGGNAGQVRIYEFVDNNWMQIGGDIDGESMGDESGYSVSLSENGNRVAIGSITNDGNGNDAGHVRVYELIGGNWVQLGTDIDGEAAGDQSGHSVSLSADGSRVAIGAKFNNGSFEGAGHVRVYELLEGNWMQIGNDIDGEAGGDKSGWAVSLSANGNRIAIGAIDNDDGGAEAGHVRVYELTGNNWVQVGQDIDGEAAGDLAGHSVSISADGNRVAIGAPQNDDNGDIAGHARIYAWDGDQWTQIETDIDGEATGDKFGWAVALSGNGNRLAIGAPFNDGNGNDAGQVRVYELQTVATIFVDNSSNATLFPNPTFDKFSISGPTKIKRIVIYNQLGSMVKGLERPGTEIDISKLPSGIYLVQIHAENQLILNKRIQVAH